MAAQRSCTTVLGKEVKMMISAKDINIKDAPDVRAMLTVVIRVRRGPSLKAQRSCISSGKD